MLNKHYIIKTHLHHFQIYAHQEISFHVNDFNLHISQTNYCINLYKFQLLTIQTKSNKDTHIRKLTYICTNSIVFRMKLKLTDKLLLIPVKSLIETRMITLDRRFSDVFMIY